MDKQAIYGFLLDQTRRELIYQDRECAHSLLKSVFDEGTDILYHMSEYRESHPQSFNGKCEYAGIISYKRGELIDAHYNLSSARLCCVANHCAGCNQAQTHSECLEQNRREACARGE